MRIAVILSTYNGERFLRDQIDSVLVQDIPGVSLFVRDDGSTDGTLSILTEYERAGLLTLFRGKNEGPAASFFDCLRNVEGAEYYAFCDQDDVWLSDKLARAVGMLSKSDGTGPLLYCSNLNYCDESLAYQSTSSFNRRGICLTSQLYETICSGNTMVFNNALRKTILARDTSGAYLHDWWTSLVACACGSIVWDDGSYLMYRRTRANVSPGGMSGMALMAYRVRHILGGGQLEKIQRQVEAFMQEFGDCLTPEDRLLLQRMTTCPNSRRALTPVRFRQKAGDELLLRAIMLGGLI